MENDKYPGLLVTPEDRQQAGWQGLLNLGTQMMAAGGPSSAPTSFAQALGKGGQGFMQGYQGQIDRTRQNQLGNLQAQSAQQQQALNAQKLAAGERQAAQEQALMDWHAGGRKGPMPLVTEMLTQQPTAAIQNWQFQQNLPKDQQQKFGLTQSGIKIVDIGGKKMYVDRFGQVVGSAEVGLKPGEEPATKFAQARAASEGSAIGAEAGATEASLAAATASMPKLEQSVARLKELGETATYTMAGKAADFAKKELGADPGQGAVDRGTYIAHVKNNILPLLRETFGAAFTAAEGDSLLATLGDPDMHPRVKSAVLDAFISDKKADLERLRRLSSANSARAPKTTSAAGGDDLRSAAQQELDRRAGK